MADLSVTIITYNEEDNIGGCLESIKWADEIVVVDANSTDRTVEICRKYTDKVFQHEWTDFGQQKSLALGKASNDWILSLDADERIDRALAEEIRGVLRIDYPKDGYYIPRKNYFLGKWLKHGGWYPDYHVRLFRKSKGEFEQKKVHEGIKVGNETGYLKQPIEHFPYRRLRDYFEKFQLYTSLYAEEKFEEGKRITKWAPFLRLPSEFLLGYIFRGGYKDGFHGLLLSVLSSFYVFTKYIKLWELQKTRNDE